MPSTFGILYIVIKYHAATLCGIAYSPAQRGHGFEIVVMDTLLCCINTLCVRQSPSYI